MNNAAEKQRASAPPNQTSPEGRVDAILCGLNEVVDRYRNAVSKYRTLNDALVGCADNVEAGGEKAAGNEPIVGRIDGIESRLGQLNRICVDLETENTRLGFVVSP